jgi:hypothetical protein
LGLRKTAPALAIAHLLGRPTKASSQHAQPPVTKKLPRLLDAKGGRRAAKEGSNRGSSHVLNGKPSSPRKHQFAHLRPIPIEPERDTAPVTATRPLSKAAAAILAAADRARQPTSAPAATGAAAKIIAAGKRARGEA